MEKSLKDLISRLPIPGLKESTNRHIIAELVSKELQIPVAPKQITVKEGILIISVPPVVKSALQIRQQRIITALKEEGITIHGIK